MRFLVLVLGARSLALEWKESQCSGIRFFLGTFILPLSPLLSVSFFLFFLISIHFASAEVMRQQANDRRS